ncbi:diguanylate cyclase (GGDEF)-like protein [Aneurinibacillus soli]|uniref:Response regulator PleD n=1 Tax=Aneurinibacillus soli TaxID=1500254 RepID=A0A0U5B971_9BACL|nr:sensor domain-containing diguanylate cyclase [Aneurinibacillus soli]PYE63599.1 diguanylate cyclase (GGDEF)-like protein [Aneurinibacillus soli]BAU27468.1 Response regulator PleD [Aneurinibacillus soli]
MNDKTKYAYAEEHIELLRLLNQVNAEIAGTTELERALTVIGDAIRSGIGAGTCVSLLEEEEKNLQVWLNTDHKESRYCYVLPDHAVERQVMETGRPQTLYPRRELSGVTLLPLLEYGAIWMYPVSCMGETLGVLYVFHKQECDLPEHSKEFLTCLAVRLGIAVYNWKQQEEILYQRRKLQFLYTMMAVAADAEATIEDELEVVHSQISSTFGFSRVIIGLLDEKEHRIRIARASGFVPEEWARELVLPARPGDTRHEEAFRTGLPVVVQDAKHDVRCLGAAQQLGLYSAAAVPVMYKEQALGIIYVDSGDYRRFSELTLQFLTSIARQLGTVLMNARQYDHIRRLAITDGLTGLHTRQYFSERYQEEFAAAERSGDPLSLIMIDIDDFKKINDTNGHLVGDRVLVHVSHMLQTQVRLSDTVARYGGEELIVLLPRTTLEQTCMIAERIRCAFMELPFPFSVTASIGIAVYPEHGIEKDTLLMKADDAMYRAKHEGKNQIRIAR